MSDRYFPNVPFEIGFLLLLFALLAVASWIDTKTLRIPKWLTVRMLLLGLVASAVRGLWLGADGCPVWVLNWPSAVPGALDGFLFGLCGALVGFALFTALWLTRIFVGGGDVKLVTAAGAWLGPEGILLAALCSLGAFTVLGVGRISYEMSQGVMPSLAPREGASQARKARRRISYSFSFTIGVALTLAYALRHQLGLAPATGA